MSETAADTHYQAFVENHTEGIWCLGLDIPVLLDLSETEQIAAIYKHGYFADANAAFARRFGGDSGTQIRQKRLNDLLPQTEKTNTALLRAFIRAGYALENAPETQTVDGEVRHFSHTLTGVVENGYLVRAWGTVRDTTKQFETEKKLRRSEERFRALADNIAQLAWMADSSGAIFWYNQRWFDYTGTDLESMQGWGWQKIHHPDYVDIVTEKFKTHVNSGEPWEDTFPLKGADDQFRFFLSRAFPFRDAGGNVVLWCGTNTDVTERLELEAKQRRFLREMLSSITEGRLNLCDNVNQLPVPLPRFGPVVHLQKPTLRDLRQQAQAAAGALHLTGERKADLMIAVGEVAMNAVVHAGRGVGWVGADTNRGVLQIWVTDKGKGIAPDEIHKATLQTGYTTAGTLGHGFSLLLKTADRVFLLTGPHGTTVVIEQETVAPQPSWL